MKSFFGIIFSLYYFLNLEKQAGIVNEFTSVVASPNTSSQMNGSSVVSSPYPKPQQELSQNEQSIKTYIEIV